MKGTVHLALAVLAVVELYGASKRTRKAVLGACCGWHLHSMVYHYFYEGREG